MQCGRTGADSVHVPTMRSRNASSAHDLSTSNQREVSLYERNLDHHRWAKKSEDGDYVWCRSNDATFVIGARVGVQSNWIAPIGEIFSTANRSGWERDLPDFALDSAKEEADKNIGRRIRVLNGKLVFD